MKKIIFLPILFLFSLPIFAGMQKPATKKDLALYKGIGVNYICMAGEKEIKFNKSITIASKNLELRISLAWRGQAVAPARSADRFGSAASAA